MQCSKCMWAGYKKQGIKLELKNFIIQALANTGLIVLNHQNNSSNQSNQINM